jgi:hypothetical protein
MAISLNDVDDLQEHLLGVFRRSDHHAGEVNEVLLTLAGSILWRKLPGDPVKVNTKEGAGGNVIWFRVDSIRYALLYSHVERHIKLMAGGRKGELVQTFTNATPAAEVARVFASLGNGIAAPSESRKVRREDREPKVAKLHKVEAAPKKRMDKQTRLKNKEEKVHQHREERMAARMAGKAAKAEKPPKAEKPSKADRALKRERAPAVQPAEPRRLRAVEPVAASTGG